MRTVLDLRALLAAALAFLALAGPAQAGIINGSFESGGLANWQSSVVVSGTVSAVSTIGRKGGELGSWDPTGGSSFGLLAGNGDGNSQSIWQDFIADKDGTLLFDYFFDSAEVNPAFVDSFTLRIGQWDGTAFVGAIFEDVWTVQRVGTVTGNSTASTGWLSDSFSLVAGTQYRVLGRLENPSAGDQLHGGLPGSDFNSIAGLDNFRFQGAPPAVPEPASMTLLGLGVLGLAWRRRRRAAKVAETKTEAN